uniref:hypothetical protein n=1 Tax=Paraburkholderia heleia TaxID=634127 RepID=UPI002AB6165F|nr:hypothetical protein [Paraburkholderia heleia]
MKIRILGSGAGGGLPQWNCNCANCRRARQACGDVLPRTQSSIAVSGDGTFWTTTEMIDLGLSTKHAADMGHLAQRGDDGTPGMIDWLDTLPRGTRKVLTHINNTNPVLDPHSVERAQLRAHGIDVAHDGMQFQV